MWPFDIRIVQGNSGNHGTDEGNHDPVEADQEEDDLPAGPSDEVYFIFYCARRNFKKMHSKI